MPRDCPRCSGRSSRARSHSARPLLGGRPLRLGAQERLEKRWGAGARAHGVREERIELSERTPRPPMRWFLFPTRSAAPPRPWAKRVLEPVAGARRLRPAILSADRPLKSPSCRTRSISSAGTTRQDQTRTGQSLHDAHRLYPPIRGKGLYERHVGAQGFARRASGGRAPGCSTAAARCESRFRCDSWARFGPLCR